MKLKYIYYVHLIAMAHVLQYMESTLMQKHTERYMYYARCARLKTSGYM